MMVTPATAQADPGQSDATLAPADAPLRRVITLTGSPKLIDMKSASTLDAKEKIVAEFESAPKPPGGTERRRSRADQVAQAFDNVHLTTPGRTLTACREVRRLVRPPDRRRRNPLAGPARRRQYLRRLASRPLATDDNPLPEAKPEAPPPPLEGAVDGRANFVHATIVQGVGNAKGELRDAILRGE